MSRLACVAVLAATLLLSACAGLGPADERPTVTLASLRALPSEGMVPSFEIGLRILNPSARDLRLQGVVYTIEVEGHELVKGVGKDFPVIESYGEQTITLTASANLLSGIRFLGDLMQGPDDTLDYAFNARLDLGGLYPSIRVKESGQLDLRPPR